MAEYLVAAQTLADIAVKVAAVEDGEPLQNILSRMDEMYVVFILRAREYAALSKKEI